VKLAALAIIAPEWVFLNAIASYFWVREALDDELQPSFFEGGYKFTETHAWFMAMGGVEMQFTDGNH